MAELEGRAVEHEQARRAAFHRVLRDKFFRQFEIKLSDVHGATSTVYLGLYLAAARLRL